jgi:phosphatidylserine/phosphatidylglycerophosphate/cardiolipin synthase-like enzyme
MGSPTLQVFYDPRSLEPDAPAGVLHAKAIVADEQFAFVTSANLTEAAFERNIDVGVLVRDRARGRAWAPPPDADRPRAAVGATRRHAV